MANAGDSITVIDESINFDDDVRIVKVTSNYDIEGNRVDCNVECGNLSFASQQKTSQAAMDNIIAGKAPIPNAWLTTQVQLATNNLLAARTELNFTDQGIIATDKSNANNVVLLNSAGIGISNDGGKSYVSAMTGKGINASTITTGTLDAQLIRAGFNGISTPLSIDSSGLSIKSPSGGSIKLTGDGLLFFNEKNKEVGRIAWAYGMDSNGNPIISGIEFSGGFFSVNSASVDIHSNDGNVSLMNDRGNNGVVLSNGTNAVLGGDWNVANHAG